MVLGWFKKKKGSEHIGTKSERPLAEKPYVDISLEKSADVLDNLLQIKEKELVAETVAFRRKILSSLRDLNNIAKKLESDDLKLDDVDKHLRVIASRGKRQVVSIIKTESSKEIPEVSTYDDVKTIVTDVKQIIKKIGDVLGRHSKIIHVFAKKYADKIKDNLSDISSNFEEVEKAFDNYQKMISDCNTVKELSKSIIDNKNNIANIEQKLLDVKRDKEQISTEISNVSDEIEELKKSKEYEKFQDISKLIEKRQNEYKDLQRNIDSQFTSISRPLGRYTYVSSLDKEEKELLHVIVESPFLALRAYETDSIIILLGRVRKGVETNLISVKDTSKTIASIDDVIEKLGSFKKEIYGFEKDLESLREEKESLGINELFKKEDYLKQLRQDFDNTKIKSENLNNEKKEREKNQQEYVDKLESYLHSLTGTKYRLVLT